MTKRDWLFVGCELGHDLHSIGGCNAGCHEECSCSVPVNVCRRCGDCDYGKNDEAEQVRVNCAAIWGDPELASEEA
jgi:hypothetical protein